jgi:hypothetical protein
MLTKKHSGISRAVRGGLLTPGEALEALCGGHTPFSKPTDQLEFELPNKSRSAQAPSTTPRATLTPTTMIPQGFEPIPQGFEP